MQLAVLLPLGHQADDRVGAGAELGRRGAVQAHPPGRLDAGELHAEADAQERQRLLAGVGDGRDLALDAALAEAARDQDGVHPVQPVGLVGVGELLGVDPVQVDADIVGDAAVDQRLVERLVGVEQARVLADHGHRHLALGPVQPADDLAPRAQVGPALVGQAQRAQELRVQPLLMIADRHLVDRGAVQGRDHRLGPDRALQRDLAPRVLGDRPVGAGEQDVGLDADRAQRRHRMLGGLGLQLLGRGDARHQRHVDEAALLRLVLERELADRLEERQALDVADGAADLAQDDVRTLGVVLDELLDGVGDVRDHLDGAAQIVALALAGEHGPVDAAGRHGVRGARRHAGEALVVAEVEVGLGPVVGDEHLAVLVGRHRARDRR